MQREDDRRRGGKSEKAKRRWRKFGRRNKKKENDIKNNLRYENYQNIINGKNTVQERESN